MDYAEFIAGKQLQEKRYGFDVPLSSIAPAAFDWQKRIIQWAVRRGRAAMFLDTGLGKTLCQLAWAEQVATKTKGRVLLHCPLGVRKQTYREAGKFSIGVPVVIADDGESLPKGPCIIVCNYDKLHKFEARKFCGVVLDESSILKGLDGATKRFLCEAWSRTQYRLACTATPSPNDHMELGNHAEFLGVCSTQEMLSKYFVNDTGDTGKWRLRGHAVQSFWEWVCQWACCVSMPSDVGGPDEGYILPGLHERTELVHVPLERGSGMLFDSTELSATTIHDEKRRTSPYRARKTAEIVNDLSGHCIVWLDTNYEADDLMPLLNDAVEIRGDMKDSVKESVLDGFVDGTHRVLVTKPTIAGQGMNFQHCNQMVFHAINYSFEQRYQAIRRCLRFGQTREVYVWNVTTDTEHAMANAIHIKSERHVTMQTQMRAAMAKSELAPQTEVGKRSYVASSTMEVPSWLM